MVGTRKTSDNNVYCLPCDQDLPMVVRKILCHGSGGRHQPSPPLIISNEVNHLNPPHSEKEPVSPKPNQLPYLNQGGTSTTRPPNDEGNIIVSAVDLSNVIKENISCNTCSKNRLLRFNLYCDRYRKKELSDIM